MVDSFSDGVPHLPPRAGSGSDAPGAEESVATLDAALATETAVADRAATPPPPPKPRRDTSRRTSRHPTMVARALCFAGQLGWFAVPVIVIALLQADRGSYAGDGGLLVLDSRGTEMVGKLALVVFATYQAGWLWWSTVAAINARNISRRTVWPGSPIAAFFVQLAAVATASMVHFDDDIADTAFRLTMLAVVVSAHFIVLGAFRRAAGSIRAPQSPWTRLIVLPWTVAAFNVVAAFFLNFVSASLVVVLLSVQVALLAWYVVSFYQAMTGFDHACVGRAILSQDDQAFQKFLKHRS